MADDTQKSPDEAGHAGRPRRPAPTIDLTATEVATEQAASEPAPETTSPEATETTAEAARHEPEPQSANGSPPPPRISPWWMLAAAAGGGALVAVILLLLWGIPAGTDAVERQAARMAELDKRLQELAARSAAAAAVSQEAAALAQRVGKLESAVSAPRAPDPALAERIAELEAKVADVAAASAKAVQSAEAQDAGVDPQVLASLNERVAALERTLAEQQTALASRRDTRADVRLAVVAEALKAAVARGEPFAAELKAAKALAPDQAAGAGHAPPLQALEQFADTGVPTTGKLAEQLREILPAMRRAVQPQQEPEAGFWDRLQANAERLVRVRPIGEQPGDDPGAVLARIEAKLGRGDLAGVLAEMKALPQAVRAPAQDWIALAQAREAAIAASRQFAAAHIGALAGATD